MQRLLSSLVSIALLTLAAHADEPWRGDYLYDGAGNVKAIGTNHYVYDGAGRLRQATAITATQSDVQTYAYDAFGNLLVVQTNHDASRTTAFGASPVTNRLTDPSRCAAGVPCVTASYDTAGHQLSGPDNSHYGYDDADMLTTLDAGSRHEIYVYDANDQRIATISNGATPAWHYTLRDAGADVVREWTSSGSSWAWTKDYVYRDGALLASITAANGAEQRTHFHLDHLNSPRLLTDDYGRKISLHTYWPFGLEADGSDRDTETHKFTGHERDFAAAGSSNDLDYMHARYYLPLTGRFFSVDPVLDADRATRNPQGWNRYSYVEDNPMNLTDPTGRELPVTVDMFRKPPDTPAERAIKKTAIVGGVVVAALYLGPPALEAVGQAGSILTMLYLSAPVFWHGVAQSLLMPPGASPNIPSTGIIGRMADVERVGNANPTLLRMNIPKEVWEGMTSAQQVKAVSAYAAGLGISGASIARVTKLKDIGKFTVLEIVVSDGTSAAAGKAQQKIQAATSN